MPSINPVLDADLFMQSLGSFFQMLFAKISFELIFRVSLFVLLLVLQVNLLIFVFEKTLSYAKGNRIVSHFLKIRNEGNVRQFYLIYASETPPGTSMEFRIFDVPLIRTRMLMPDDDQDADKKAEAPVQTKKNAVRSDTKSLIPNLNDPFGSGSVVSNAQQSVKKVNEKVGLFARFFSALSPFLPNFLKEKIDPLQKNLQAAQQELSSMQRIPDTLKRQAESLKTQTDKLASGLGAEPSGIDLKELDSMASEITYDNFDGSASDKKDSRNQIICYQTPPLAPGEEFDIEIRFDSSKIHFAPATFKYELNVLLFGNYFRKNYFSGTEIINGVISFKPTPLWRVVLPYFITAACACLTVAFMVGVGTFLFKG